MGIQYIHDNHIDQHEYDIYQFQYVNDKLKYQYNNFHFDVDDNKYNDDDLERICMKILFNPIEGTEIHDVMYRDLNYFSREWGEQWYEGTLRQFEEDAIADFFVNLFGFLEPISVDKAAELQESMSHMYQCKEPGCKFETNLKHKLMAHAKEHIKDKKLSVLGLPVVRSREKSQAQVESEREKKFEQENQAQGLTEGSGLTEDIPPSTAVMS